MDRPRESGEEEIGQREQQDPDPAEPRPRRIMTSDEVRRALVRIGHEIVEKHGGTDDLALVGIERRGVPLAQRIADVIEANEGVRLPVGSLDITFYRDDLSMVDRQPRLRGTTLPFDPAATTIVIVDDVLYTGAPCGPRWTRWWTRVGRPPSGWRCWSIVGTGSCPSAPTTWARTCPRRVTRSST